ncbi:MAG: SDR family oxidoreductase [Pirellulaceae bacterium]|nr:SDR family oxidoreductase [Pirellulaceae bacterium]MDP6557738.1 SDR family oxidoreductase [Pirellulaceae bacterium]
MAKLIFGCGYVGSRVARRWLDGGDRVFALTRKPARAAELEELGVFPMIGDVTESLTLPLKEDFDTVLYAIGFDRSSPHTIDEVYVDGLARALAALPIDVQRIIYTSSTGVYGQSAGEWVNEESPCEPQRAGGKAVLAAEQLLANHPLGARAIVLRLAGIYGPNRVPMLQHVQRGRPLALTGNSLLNLIHVDDVVEGVLAAENSTQLPSRYNIADGCPVRRADFYGELARQLGVDPPCFVEPNRQLPTAQRDLSSKRVRNTRMITDLLPGLLYPTYREGLASVIRSASE